MKFEKSSLIIFLLNEIAFSDSTHKHDKNVLTKKAKLIYQQFICKIRKYNYTLKSSKIILIFK